jgi:hypothetical protein
MVAPADFGLSPRHFRIRGRHELVELTPSLCPNGHRFDNGSHPHREFAVRRVHRIEPPHMALPVSSMFRRLDLAGM